MIVSKHSGAGGSLRADALGTFDSVVMAVAGCGPAYTIAGTFPALIAAVGVAGPAVLLYCALPVLGIALAFRHLGRLDPNAGASYAWTGRSLHPSLGFLSGWALVVSATVFMASTALPAGAATLSLFGVPAAGHTALATAVGAGWFLLVAGVVMYGARISAHAQTAVTGTQLVLLLAFAVAALSTDGNVADFSLSWFGFGHFDGQHHFVTGALIAVFAYWGWDVTSNLGEETRSGRRGSGFGGVIGVVTCFALFVVFTISVNILVGTDVVRQNPESFLTVLGDAVWPGWGGRLLVLAVLLSTVATLETSLIQATRTLFAMGRDRTLPPAFGRIHSRSRTPWTATAVVAGVALALTVAANLGSGTAPAPGAAARRRGQRRGPADLLLLRPRRVLRRRGPPQAAVRVRGEPAPHRPVAAGRRSVHGVDLRPVADRAERPRPRHRARNARAGRRADAEVPAARPLVLRGGPAGPRTRPGRGRLVRSHRPRPLLPGGTGRSDELLTDF